MKKTISIIILLFSLIGCKAQQGNFFWSYSGQSTWCKYIGYATYDGISYSVNAESLTPIDIKFKHDGTKMYILDLSVDKVFQYSLSTAWDISTASYDLKTFTVTTQESLPNSVEFKSDGTKMYIMGSNQNKVFQYSLSTAWDISTASYDVIQFSVPYTGCAELIIEGSGNYMYIVDRDGLGVERPRQYTLSTAWDIATATETSYIEETNQSGGIHISPDGKFIYYLSQPLSNNPVRQYNLSTPFNLSTATYCCDKGVGSTTLGLTFKPDGTKFYIVDNGTNSVEQWTNCP